LDADGYIHSHCNQDPDELVDPNLDIYADPHGDSDSNITRRVRSSEQLL
jgi:hypothetical protein